MNAQRRLFGALLAIVITLGLLAGCGKKDDPIAQAEKKDVAKGVAAPSIVETKTIAEEGFIYGLPLVMNYAVMYEYAVDTKSSQFKAPFNELNNMHRVATYEGHGDHHAQQRHALFAGLHGSARGADRAVGAGRAEDRATTRCS